MGLFDMFKKKEQPQSPCCGCSGGCATPCTSEESARVKVLGSGCQKCNELELHTKTALENLGMDTAIDHVTDFTQIAAYGVMTTPALVLDDKVLSYGKVLSVEEVETLLQQANG